jgi:hypothetical protein
VGNALPWSHSFRRRRGRAARARKPSTLVDVQLRPSDLTAVIWNWARAEVDSPRFGAYWSTLPPRILAALRSGDSAVLSRDEWGYLKATAEQIRGPLLKGLLRLGTEWHIGTIATADAEQLRLAWFHAMPSRRLGALVDILDSGGNVPGEGSFAPNFRAARRAIDVSNMRGAPILVAESGQGPYGLLEGYIRCSVLVSRLRANEPVPAAIQVIVGVCPRIREWRLNDDPAGLELWVREPLVGG